MNKLEINEKILAILKGLEELKDWRPDLLNTQIDSIISDTKKLRDMVFEQPTETVNDVDCINTTIEYLNEIIKQLNENR